MDSYRKPIQPWAYVFGSNSTPYRQERNMDCSPLLSYNGPGSFQTIDGKMVYLPGAEDVGNVATEQSNRYPMLWYWSLEGQQNVLQGQQNALQGQQNALQGQQNALQGQQNVLQGETGNMLFRGSGGHRQYFQQGFYPPMDSSGHILPPTKLVSGISREQMSSLPVQFYDVHFNSGVAYNTVPGADAQSAFPAPIPVPITGYGQEYAQRNEFHPTRITDRIQDTVIPECGAPQIFSPELPYYSATHQYESATPPSYDPRNNLYGSQHVAPLPAEPDVPHSFPDKYTRTVPKIEVVEVPVEVIRYVPKIETKIVEQVVEVPGPEKIPVPRPYFVDVQVVEPKYEDRDIPLIVSQNVVPEIQEVSDVIEIEVFKYEPEVTYVDVYVPRPVAIPIKATGVVEQKEIPSQGISEEQLRIAMDEINPHLHDVENYNNAQAGTFESLVQQSESTARIHGLEAPDPIRRPMYSLEDERKTEEVAPEEAEAVATIDNVETDTTDVQ